MTKMPEPVAYFYEWELDKYKNPYPQGIGVITAIQAEAYANERVRVALEEVIKTIEWSDDKLMAEYHIERIRQLIPKERS